MTTPPLVPCFHGNLRDSFLSYAPSFLVVMEMEASGKWPDSPDSIEDIKTVFYVEISRLLKRQYQLVTAPSKDFIDVLKVNVVGVFLVCSM